MIAHDDVPELPTRGTYDPDAEDFDTLTFSPEDDLRLTLAAQRGPTAIRMALAGDPAALEEMRKLRITRWEHVR